MYIGVPLTPTRSIVENRPLGCLANVRALHVLHVADPARHDTAVLVKEMYATVQQRKTDNGLALKLRVELEICCRRVPPEVADDNLIHDRLQSNSTIGSFSAYLVLVKIEPRGGFPAMGFATDVSMCIRAHAGTSGGACRAHKPGTASWPIRRPLPSQPRPPSRSETIPTAARA